MRWSEIEAHDLSYFNVVVLVLAAGGAGWFLRTLPPFVATLAGGVVAGLGIALFGYEPLSNIHWILAGAFAARSSAVVGGEFYS
jgi:Kef-type K+ transport system membrane component KefB